MRGAVMLKPGDVEIRDLPEPEVGPGDVLVQVAEVALCKSELDRYTGAMHLPEPLRFGHEVIGTVVETGGEVTTVQVGDQVVPYAEPMHGCADLVAVPANRCVKLPTDATAGVLTELLACAVGAIDTANVQPTDSVAIIGGTGALGELLRAVLNYRYPELANLFVLGRNPEALERAGSDGRTVPLNVSERLLDARPVIFDATNGEGADVVLEVSGAAPMLYDGPKLARTNGTFALVSYPAEPVLFDFHDVCGRAVSLPVAHWRNADLKQAFMQEAADLIASGDLDIAGLITDRYALDDVQDAFKRASTGGAVKVVIEL